MKRQKLDSDRNIYKTVTTLKTVPHNALLLSIHVLFYLLRHLIWVPIFHIMIKQNFFNPPISLCSNDVLDCNILIDLEE